jgi:hypothetical protein
VSSALINILIGLVTSVLSGTAVLLWRQAAGTRVLRRKAAFFGLRPGGNCLIVMNNHWQLPGSTSHDDVKVMLQAATLAQEAGSQVSLIMADKPPHQQESCVEFCIGGPFSNPRTAAHLAAYLPSVRFRPISDKRSSGAIVVAGRQFTYKRGQQEYALIARFTPRHSSDPVFLICGQRSIDNLAAITFLKREYRLLSKSHGMGTDFCLVIRVISPDTYGYLAAQLEADVTAPVFRAMPRVAPAPAP